MNVPAGSTVTATWSNIAPTAPMLAMWVSYADTVCDIPYVFYTQPYLAYLIPSPTLSPATPAPVYIDVLNAWTEIYTNNGEALTGKLFADLNETSHTMFKVFNFAACLYSPFGQIAQELVVSSIDPDQGGSSPFERLLFSSTWRTPIYLPSIFTECIASVAEQTIIKSTQEGFTHSVQIFNVPSWPVYETTTLNQYVSIFNMTSSLVGWEQILNYRKFIKLNLNPEYKVNKAVMPYFFIHVPIKKTIKLPSGVVEEPFDAIVTPYSARYVEDHNLHVLCRCMPWPRVYDIPQALVSWLPIIDVKPMLPDVDNWDVLLPAFDVYQFSLLCVDMSFMADGCEMDSYLHKLRTSHLGFFCRFGWSFTCGNKSWYRIV